MTTTVRAVEGTGTIATVEDAIDAVFEPVASVLSTVVFFEVSVAGASFPLIVGWLVLAGIMFTAVLRGIQARGFGHGVALARGRYDRPEDPGEVTHFQALSSAVSGTVGLGNIALYLLAPVVLQELRDYAAARRDGTVAPRDVADKV